MPTPQLSAPTAAVHACAAKPVAADVLHFLESKARHRQMPADAARQRSMALRQLLSALRDDEPRELGWLAENLEEIAKRWATDNEHVKGDTSRTYLSRARACILDYLAWRADPTGWSFKQRRPPSRKKARASSLVPSEARQLPLADGTVFVFALPERALTLADVRRISHHLASFAQDFDTELTGGTGT